MRNFLGLSTLFSFLLVNINNLVSCVEKYKFDNTIWVISDSGTISDLSFNQSAWEGASQYVVSVKDLDNFGSNDKWKNSKWRASFFEPAYLTTSDLKMAYITATIAGAKTIILPGFAHKNTIGWAAAQVDNVIYVDGSCEGIYINMNKNNSYASNIVGLLYESEVSGFYAGIAASVYLNAYQDDYRILKIATYGGMDCPFAVSNYMWGYLVASDIFNVIIHGDINLYPKITSIKNKVFDMIYKLNPKKTKNLNLKRIEKSQEVLDLNESWFSQSFESGHGRDISDYLINTKESSVIFPVAGPQTQDTIDRIKYAGSKAINTKVVGVDTKQSRIYGDKYVITSALKGIKESVTDALLNIYSSDSGYDTKTKKWNNNKINLKTSWINTNQSSNDHVNWIGIESTKLIPADIVEMIHNSTDDFNRDTVFDKIGKILVRIYTKGIDKNDKVSSISFIDTLKNTYDSQNSIKPYFLRAIEKIL